MAEGRFVSYLRVSTAKQGKSGLGLDAQRSAVAGYLNGGAWKLLAEVVEVESGKRNDRPKLAEAMALCRLHGAVLLVAKLDRLSRDAAFLMNLQSAGVRFVAADLPQANEMTVGIMSVVAQAERRAISTRTKEALAAKRAWYAKATPEALAAEHANGKTAIRLGGPRWDHIQGVVGAKGRAASLAKRQARATDRAGDLAPIIASLQADGVTTLAALAEALTARGIPTARGAAVWTPMQVSRVLKRA
jgi:hypothetical protein